ncbi:MAG: DUF1499 domain-containing protein [Wenzhouxiangella sp.]
MSLLSRLLTVIALLALVLLLVAGPGTRMEFWDFRFGFTLMRWAVYFGAAAAGLALILLLIPRARRGRATALLLSLVIGAGVAAVPAWQLMQVRSLPMIHDITTDFVDPPAFEAILPLRADAPNPPEHEGEAVARQQREAYPDILPLLTATHPAITFEHALDAAQSLGWEIVAAEPERGIIEATDTTLWFGFQDDVVIRILAEPDGSRVDMRSKSRVGLSDVGANAQRVRRFMQRLEDRLYWSD